VFDIGIQELIIIFLVALLVFGPDKLPEVGRTLGRWIIEIRKGIHNAKIQMETEFEASERETAEETKEAQPAEEEKRADAYAAERKEGGG
jgi:sec-independent protein translocase protein TatB